MIATIAFIAFLLFLMKFSDRNKRWWLCFTMIFGLLAKWGCRFNIFSLMIAMIIWTAVKDTFSRGGIGM